MLPKFLFRMWRRGGYRQDFLQRFGFYSPDILERLSGNSRVWFHAVSVGEIYVALRFMHEMRASVPGLSFVITTTTSTGHKIAQSNMNKDDVLLYFPCDFPPVMKRVLRIIRPGTLILTEGEIWPNLIRMAKDENIPVILVNGRISESSCRGYRMLKLFFKPIIKCFDLILVQSETDKARLIDLGAEDDKIKVMGTAKYDIVPSGSSGNGSAGEIFIGCGFGAKDVIIVGGSTWPGEEDILLGIYQKLKTEYSGLRLVLVPRHAERRGEVESIISRYGCSFTKRSQTAALRGKSDGDRRSEEVEVLLVDTTGELKDCYADADVIFVGKSLTQHGGQNIIEAAAYSKAIITGPNMENFKTVVADLRVANAMIQVADAKGLEEAIRRFVCDPAARQAYGERAGKVVAEKRGSVNASVKLMETYFHR